MNLYNKIVNISRLEDSEHFELFKNISYAINSNAKEENTKGRNLLIRVIDKWNEVPTNFKPMWEDLIEAVGFYPYISKYKMTIGDLSARIRQEYHKSDFIPDKYLHKEQKELSNLLVDKRNVIVSAPTSFGKSLLIEEIVSSRIYNNIVIIQPTLALLDETRIKLKKYYNDYKIIVRTSQEASLVKGNIFLLTAERVLEYPNLPEIDLLVIDEFYKLSKQRNDNRANILNIAFIRLMKNKDCRFYLLGPNIERISKGFEEKYNAEFFSTDYSLVYTEEQNLYESVKIKPGGKVCEENIFDVLDSLDEQSLVFCSSPTTARKLAFSYCNHLEEKNIQQNNDIPLIQWIEENLNLEWSLSHCLSNEIGVHDGSMPKHITTSMIKYFNDKKIRYLFCTNTIIEGVNTSAKNVVYYDNQIGKKDVDYFDYSNIRGRAGRLMEHCVGKIINLKKPPKKEEMVVDIPAFTQNPIDDEVLINIDKKDIIPINKKRYENFEVLPDKLKEILKRNAVSIKDQLEILNEIEIMLQDPEKKSDIIWSDPRDKKLYYHLCTIFELVKDKFIEGDEKNVIISIPWMARQTVSYCYEKNISKMINERISFYSKKRFKKLNPELIDNEYSLSVFKSRYFEEYRKIVDEAIEQIFKFQKNWLQYKIPKWLNVVDSLQRYVADEMGIISGDYSFIAESIENEFIEPNIRILTEFGIPSSAISKICEYFGGKIKDLTEDEVIETIKNNKYSLNRILNQYEIESIERCL